jgi:DNA polymerase III alpha subunit
MFCRQQSDEDDMRVEFQEELMSQLHRDFGLPLRIAYETIRRVVSSNLNRLESTKQELWIQGKENGLNDDILVKIWKAILEKSPHAICKAHALSVAHLALQTAYLKAHRNGERTITPDFGIDLGGRLGESRFPF